MRLTFPNYFAAPFTERIEGRQQAADPIKKNLI